MPLTLTQIEQRTADATLTYLGETVNAVYYAGRALALSEAEIKKFQRELDSADRDDTLRRQLARFFLRYIAGWDVEDGQGAVVALEEDVLCHIDPYFLTHVLAEVFRAARDAKPAGTTPSAPTPRPLDDSSKRRAGGTSSRKASSRPNSTRRSSRAGRTSRPGS